MEELNKENLKVIRLNNSEILFSKVLVTDQSKDAGYLELHWPMKLLINRDHVTGHTNMALLKWLPFTDSTFVPLSVRCIMSISSLGEQYEDFYVGPKISAYYEDVSTSSTASLESTAILRSNLKSSK